MTKKRLYIFSTVLILLALVLIVTGLGSQAPVLWGAGLAVITAAMLLSLGSRWAR